MKHVYRSEKRLVRRARHRIKLLTVLFWLFACCFVVSAFFVGRYLYRSRREAGAFEQLSHSVLQQAAQASTQEGSADAAELLAQAYAAVSEQNEDYVGWLVMEEVGVDYPVMYTPDDPEYYLRRAFDGSYAVSGTPFLGEDCTVDSDCVIVYAHNMNDGSMFGELDRYRDEAFYAENTELTFYVDGEARRYEVFAAVRTRVLRQNEEGFRYYYAGGDCSEEERRQLLDWLADNALYDTGVAPGMDEQLLLLSTCSYHTQDGRFLVAARRIADG